MTYTEVAQAREALATARAALVSLGDGLAFVQTGELAALAAEAAAVAARARGLLTAVTAEARSRGVVRQSGSGSDAQWLIDAGASVSVPEAHAVRRALDATATPVLAGLREALVAGDVAPSDAHAAGTVFAELRTATDPAMHADMADAVTTLARTGLSRRVLQRFKAEMLARYGTLDDEQRARDHAEARRGLSGWRHLDDGVWGIEGIFDAADKATIDAALTALAAPAPDPETGEVDIRFPAQRRADALVTMARLIASEGTTGPMGTTTRVTLVLTPEALAQPCEHRARDTRDLWRGLGTRRCDCPTPAAGTDDLGTTVLPAYARELSCDAEITPVVVGPLGRPLAVGRTARLATAAQRRALEVRDGGCSFPGCGAPSSWAQAHHLTHWADGGPTDLDNLALLCGRHHRFVHQHDVTGEVRSDGSGVTWHVVNTVSGWRPRPPGEPGHGLAA